MAGREQDFVAIGFNRFEAPVVAKLDSYLRDEAHPPLLTNNEEDLTIDVDIPFIEKASQSWLPANIANLRRSGELTQEDIARRLRIGRNVVRKAKASMFTDRLIVATDSVDTCRSVYRASVGHEFVPVPAFDDDTLDQARNRVGDYVDGMLQGGRDRRVLRNAAMHRLTDTIRDKFDFESNPDAARVLTALAGLNTRKKVLHYARALHTITKGFDRMTKADKDRLHNFFDSRPPEFQAGLDVRAILGLPEPKKIKRDKQSA